MSDDAEMFAKTLEAHPDYRVLRRLVIRDEFEAGVTGSVVRGVILDTETTGMDRSTDKIVEIGLVAFEFDSDTGAVYRVTDVYAGLEDPGMPIPPEATAVHGISDADVAGQQISDSRVEEVMRDVRLVIAHNAEFDRPFVEARFPSFASLPWACSFRDIDWEAEGVGSAKLEYLAYASGFFFDAHRAEVDCRALLEVLRTVLPKSGTVPTKALYDRTKCKDLRIRALNSPYEAKDVLKARGYRWDNERRVWHTAVGMDAAKDEVAWLKEAIYKRPKVLLEFESVDALNRYSDRAGKVVRREV